MRYCKILLCIFLTFYSVNAFPAVFLVTSNADSGPGTLRDALTQAAANGSATQDVINFNIADVSVAGRTITLQSELPHLGSNLVIDATTQPGLKFGISDAKIELTVNRVAFVFRYITSTSGFVIYKASNIEIYGMYITGFNYLSYGVTVDAGIIIADSQNIQIGKPGKGNWINNCNFSILASGIYEYYTNTTDSNITVQSNNLGYETSTLSYSSDGLALYADNITIGGDIPSEGNYIGDKLSVGGNHIKISNNINGIDGNGDMTKYKLPNWQILSSSDVNISYNQSVRLNTYLTSVTNFKIYANYDSSNIYLGAFVSVGMTNCSDGIIGAEDENLKNIFVANQGSSLDYLTSAITNSGSKNIEVLKNTIICSRYPYSIYTNYIIDPTIPLIKILVNNNSEYSGTASPLSDVYIYYDDSECPICSPIKFYKKITADALGNWKITGNFTGIRWLSNALLINSSSEFTIPTATLTPSSYIITQPTCGQNNGAIELVNYKHALRIEWFDANDANVGSSFKLQNIAPGSYYAILYNGNCSFKLPQRAYLYDLHPTIYTTDVIKKDPSCGLNNGSVKGLTVDNNANNPVSYVWTDQRNQVVSKNIDLLNVSIGSFTLSVSDNVTHCTATYGPITLKNTTGPNIDQSNPVIVPSLCGASQGSVSNIAPSGTGTLTYSWRNAQQQIVATTLNLHNQPAGDYTLQVTDQSACGPVSSSAITIPEINGVAIDVSALALTPALCGNNNGTITGIKVTGATSYKWYDSGNNIVSTTTNLTGAKAGTYYLVAANATCIEQTPVYTIVNQTNTTNYGGLTKVLVNATCGLNNGSIQVIFMNPTVLPASYRWENSAGQTVGTNSATLSGIDAGSYKIYVSDNNGCEKFLITYSISRVASLAVTQGNTTDENCGLKNGSITGVTASGGKLPYAYTWQDAVGNTVGTSASLTGVAAGTYNLLISDATGCGAVSSGSYIINDQSDIVPPPSVSNVQLCGPGDAIVIINNPSSKYKYRLYDSQTATVPLAEQTDARFKISVKANTDYYVSELIGTCESQRVPLKVTVGLTAFNIANTFTPNGDGLNDTWKITGIENYPASLVQVYNRLGQSVFKSTGYGIAFDGTANGQSLPAGTYYYIINLGTKCDLISGSLAILR